MFENNRYFIWLTYWFSILTLSGHLRDVVSKKRKKLFINKRYFLVLFRNLVHSKIFYVLLCNVVYFHNINKPTCWNNLFCLKICFLVRRYQRALEKPTQTSQNKGIYIFFNILLILTHFIKISWENLIHMSLILKTFCNFEMFYWNLTIKVGK